MKEGIELRDAGWRGDVLVLGNVLAVADRHEQSLRIKAMLEHELAITIADLTALERLDSFGPPRPLPVHLKIDTGMGRMGVLPDDCGPLVSAVRRCDSVRLAGVYSHFATADFRQPRIADLQEITFAAAVQSLKSQLPARCLLHLANSAATITRPTAHYDMVRPGLAMYGYAPAPFMREMIDLRPILRLTSHVSAVKMLPAGHCVGYGQTFTTQRPTKLGIVPVGYFDGFLRRLSNRAVVGTERGPAPIIGLISMDQLAIDVTDLGPVETGCDVVLIDPDAAAENSVESLAERMETIPYEITCCLGARIDRVVVRDAGVGTRDHMVRKTATALAAGAEIRVAG